MSDEKEEIRRLEKEIEVLEMLIKNHGKKEQRSISANHGRKLAAPVPVHGSAHGNRYQWTKKDLASDCSSKTYNGTYTNLERNYVLGNCSQQEQGADMQHQECLCRNKPTAVYKTDGQLTVSNSSVRCIQPRTVSSTQKRHSVQNGQTALQKISAGCIDKKATPCIVSKSQQPISSADSAVAMTLTTERSQTQLVATNVVSKEAVVAKRVAEINVKNVASVPKCTIADKLQKNVHQRFVRSNVANQICLANKAETSNPVGVVTKPSNHMNSLCAINKYKLIRPADENNLQQVVTRLPHASHSACKQVLFPKKKFPKSLVPISFHEKSQDVIHKSKYKLVKSVQDSSNSNSDNIVLPDSQIAPLQLSEVCGSRGTYQGHQKCHSANVDRHTYSAPISIGTSVTNISKAPANSVHIVSRYKLVKKALQTSHLKHQQINKESKKKCSSTRCFAHNMKKKGWITKYALKREFGDVSQTSNCINAILGRKVRNLSANKYKFINARPASSQPSANSVQKRRTLKIDRRKSARSSVQPRRLSWSTMVPNSSSSSHLNLNQSRRKPLSFARQLNRLELQRFLTRKKSSAIKVTSRSQNSSSRYCIFYSRFGHCNSGDHCQYIHDPDRISVCTRFLRGTCRVTDCPFSHKVAKHKMPMCRFFIRRACNRDDCPYSHVNVAKDAEVCTEFLKGFCAEGDLCKKKHMLVCPDFSENGSCPRGKSCPMRHPKTRKAQQKLNSIESPSKKSKLNSENVEKLKKEEDTAAAGFRSIPLLPSDVDDINLPWKERRLPAYIALNASSVNDDSLKNAPGTLTTVPGCSTKLNIHPRIKMPSESTYEEIEAIIQQSSQES